MPVLHLVLPDAPPLRFVEVHEGLRVNGVDLGGGFSEEIAAFAFLCDGAFAEITGARLRIIYWLIYIPVISVFLFLPDT